jgi:hypothetical protein
VDGPSRGAVERLGPEQAQRRTVELVRLAELVHEPDNLVRMAHRI